MKGVQWTKIMDSLELRPILKRDVKTLVEENFKGLQLPQLHSEKLIFIILTNQLPGLMLDSV